MVGMYGAIYRFFTILLMYIYRKATKVQVKIVLKTSLEQILSTMILILIYLPRYFFLILVRLLMSARKSLSVNLRLIQKSVHLICIANQLTCFYMIQIFTERYSLTGVSILIYVRCFENNSIFTEIKQNHIRPFPIFCSRKVSRKASKLFLFQLLKIH